MQISLYPTKMLRVPIFKKAEIARADMAEAHAN